MTGTPILRSVAAAVLLLGITTAPAAAADDVPRCMGYEATIIGTMKADVLRGTPKRDIIVGRAGNDIIKGRAGNDVICGGAGDDVLVGKAGWDKLDGGFGDDVLRGSDGNDKLWGSAGYDLLRGGSGDDRLDGGPATDSCYQDAGDGTRTRCELPGVIVPPAPKTLVVAYSEMNGKAGYQGGTTDVLISKLVDTNVDGIPSKGDTIVMGRYPTSLDPGAGDFADWTDKSHTVGSFVDSYRPTFDGLVVGNAADPVARHAWTGHRGNPAEGYSETDAAGRSSFLDYLAASGHPNWLVAEVGSPSGPSTAAPQLDSPAGVDDPFVDVEFYY